MSEVLFDVSAVSEIEIAATEGGGHLAADVDTSPMSVQRLARSCLNVSKCPSNAAGTRTVGNHTKGACVTQMFGGSEAII